MKEKLMKLLSFYWKERLELANRIMRYVSAFQRTPSRSVSTTLTRRISFHFFVVGSKLFNHIRHKCNKTDHWKSSRLDPSSKENLRNFLWAERAGSFRNNIFTTWTCTQLNGMVWHSLRANFRKGGGPAKQRVASYVTTGSIKFTISFSLLLLAASNWLLRHAFFWNLPYETVTNTWKENLFRVLLSRTNSLSTQFIEPLPQNLAPVCCLSWESCSVK